MRFSRGFNTADTFMWFKTIRNELIQFDANTQLGVNCIVHDAIGQKCTSNEEEMNDKIHCYFSSQCSLVYVFISGRLFSAGIGVASIVRHMSITLCACARAHTYTVSDFQTLRPMKSVGMSERASERLLSLFKCYHKHLLEFLCNFTLALIHALADC